MALNIDISELSFSFGRNSHQLRNVNLAVAEGELCCLLGPNGAGKTTLIRCLLGLLRPDAGEIRVMGQDATKLSTRQLARLVAYVPQATSTTFPFTTFEIVLMGRTPHLKIIEEPSSEDRAAARTMLERLGIGHLEKRSFAQLSGGEKQMAMIARALVQEAGVLVLDEPTAALDYGNEVEILEVIRDLVAEGRTVLMTTHQPNHALMWADRAVLMAGGTVLVGGKTEEVITASRLSELYHVPIQLARLPPPAPGGQSQLACLPVMKHSSRLTREADSPPSCPPERRLNEVTT